MSWIHQTIQFYTGARHSVSDQQTNDCYQNDGHYADLCEDRKASEREHATNCAREIKELWLSECDSSSEEVRHDQLTPKEHGMKLLQLTKAKALRQTWAKLQILPKVHIAS